MATVTDFEHCRVRSGQYSKKDKTEAGVFLAAR